ncbi:MAG: transcriptional regulator [Pseudomonadales bacterium]|nr:transcriptional regulator [Pseudomonadales bacterium]
MYTFIETRLFTRLAGEYLDHDEYVRLQLELIANPGAGFVIPGTGGIRKLRWSMAGRGKRGALRVIYYARLRDGVIWLLTLYPKSVRDNIPPHMLRQIAKELDDVD